MTVHEVMMSEEQLAALAAPDQEQQSQHRDGGSRHKDEHSEVERDPLEEDLTPPGQDDLNASVVSCAVVVPEVSSATTAKEKVAELNSLPETLEEINQRLATFEHIKENRYLCERKVNKQSRGMECDCSLSKEDVVTGRKGCGDDCLNRLLMIECDKTCSLGKHCSNKKFQNCDNAPVEVFKTEWKGFGLRAKKNIQVDEFVMEYVGEVLDEKLFRKRARRYARDDVQHFYFMALTSEMFIDASTKGNISRFINHSCDPNAETQKWTVNGELRIGFFTRRNIRAGEELTFDYKYERYGQEAQKCYCGSNNCRGWLGGDPGNKDEDDEDDDDEEEAFWSSSSSEEELLHTKPLATTPRAVQPTPSQAPSRHLHLNNKLPSIAIRRRRRKRRSPKKIKNFEDDEEDEEIDMLKRTGIRTKRHTLVLTRLMVRTTDLNTRLTLTELFTDADSPCKRLFLDYNGLPILQNWMTSLGWTERDLRLKLACEKVLACLRIPHCTVLKELKIWNTMMVWAEATRFNEAEVLALLDVNNSKQPSRNSSPLPVATEPAVKPSEPLPSVQDPSEPLPPVQDPSEPLPPGLEPDEISEFVPAPTQVLLEKATQHHTSSSSNSPIIDMKNEHKEFEVIHYEEKMVKDHAETLCRQQVSESDHSNTSEEKPSSNDNTDVKPISKAEVAISDERKLKLDSEFDQLLDELTRQVQEQAKVLLADWEKLQECFKIPRKEKQKLRTEHEFELDQQQQQQQQQQNINGKRGGFSTYHRNSNNNHADNGDVVPTVPMNSKRERSISLFDDQSGLLNSSKLSREHRRQLFQLKAETEKVEKERRQQLQMQHENKCYYLRLDPALTPMFPQYPEFYFDPMAGHWMEMPPPYPEVEVKWGYARMALLPLEAFKEDDPPFEDPRFVYPPGVVEDSRFFGEAMELSEQPLAQPEEITSNGNNTHHQQPSHVPSLLDPADSSSADIAMPFSSPHTEPMPLQPDYDSLTQPPEAVHNSEAATAFQQQDGLDLTTVAGQKAAAARAVPNVVLRLPPHWKTAKDVEGRLYFYNTETRQVQWDPPADSVQDQDSDCTSLDDVTIVEIDNNEANGDSDDEEEDDDDDEEEEEEDSAKREAEMEILSSDLSLQEKELLLTRKKKTKAERQQDRREKRERDREKREYERKQRRGRHGRHRKDGLVKEHLIPRRTDKDKLDLMTFEEIRERLANRDSIREQQEIEERVEAERERKQDSLSEKKRILKQQQEVAQQQQASSSQKGDVTTTAAADTSSEVAKKIRDKFLKDVAKVVKKVLSYYFSSEEGKKAKISSEDDFRHLAKKLTNYILTKEMKHCSHIEDLKCSDSVKKKTTDFVKKYMMKYDKYAQL